MSEHPREHEELLAALAAGERLADDADVARRVRECPECASAWAELEDTRRRLERSAAAQGEALEELTRLRGAPGEEHVLATLEGLAGGRTPVHRRAWRAWLVAALVVAAGAWIVVRLRSTREPEREPIPLGPVLVLESPVGEASFESFSWSYPEAQVDHFVLKIYASPRAGAPLIEQKHLEESQWTPDPQEAAELPYRIHWTVEARDAFDQVLTGGRASAEAWRSSSSPR